MKEEVIQEVIEGMISEERIKEEGLVKDFGKKRERNFQGLKVEEKNMDPQVLGLYSILQSLVSYFRNI